MKVYLIEDEQLEQLQNIASRLQGGSDRMRDEGHKLWLLIQTIKDQQTAEAFGGD